jgi:hypothetical protein
MMINEELWTRMRAERAFTYRGTATPSWAAESLASLSCPGRLEERGGRGRRRKDGRSESSNNCEVEDDELRDLASSSSRRGEGRTGEG